MLTPPLELELQRVRDHAEACLVGTWAAGLVSGLCLFGAWFGGPSALGYVAAFDGGIALVLGALYRRLRARRAELERES